MARPKRADMVSVPQTTSTEPQTLSVPVDEVFEVVSMGDSKPMVRVKKDVIQKVDEDVLDGMSTTNRKKLTHASEDSLTLRQKQSAGAEWLASFVGHPAFRKRSIEEGLKDPIAFLKIASSERPKEIHMEADIQHSVVVVPAPQSEEEWKKSVQTLEGEVIKEDKW